jgi:hypothetical protein
MFRSRIRTGAAQEKVAMNPNVTVGYMAEQINRGRLNGVAARGWRADEAAATHSRSTKSAHVARRLGGALALLRELLQRPVRPVAKRTNPAAIPMR